MEKKSLSKKKREVADMQNLFLIHIIERKSNPEDVMNAYKSIF